MQPSASTSFSNLRHGPILVQKSDGTIVRLRLRPSLIPRNRRPPLSRFLFNAVEFQDGVAISPANTVATAKHALDQAFPAENDPYYQLWDCISVHRRPGDDLHPRNFGNHALPLSQWRSTYVSSGSRSGEDGSGVQRVTHDGLPHTFMIGCGLNRNGYMLRGLCQLTSLVHLELRSCRITVIPAYIVLLQNLQVLDVSNNCLTTIPLSMQNMRRLTDLNMGANQLQHFPVHMRQLFTLSIFANKLVDFPTVAQLQHLRLTEISMIACMLSHTHWGEYRQRVLTALPRCNIH